MVTSQTLELIFNQLLLYIIENLIYNWQGGERREDVKVKKIEALKNERSFFGKIKRIFHGFLSAFF